MARLFVLFFLMLPWWAFFPIAAGVGWLAEKAHTSAQEKEAVRYEALQNGPPPAVDLSEFQYDQHVGLADEVNIVGWINTDYNYTLVERTNGLKTDEHFLYMLFGSEQGRDAKIVRAAMVMSEKQVDQFVEKLDDFVIGVSFFADPKFAFNGTASTYSSEGTMVRDAIADEGLQRADDFFYLTPFLNGREVDLYRASRPNDVRLTMWLVALGIALFGVVKRFFKKAERAGRKTDGSLDSETVFTPAPPGGANPELTYRNDVDPAKQHVPLANGLDPNSPLGRMAQARATAAQPEPPLSASKSPARAKVAGGFGMRKAATFALLVVGVGLIGSSFVGSQLSNMLMGSSGLTAQVVPVEHRKSDAEGRPEATPVSHREEAVPTVSNAAIEPVAQSSATPHLMPSHTLPVAPAPQVEPQPVPKPVQIATPVSHEPTTPSLIGLALKGVLGVALIFGLWKLAKIIRVNQGSRKSFDGTPDEAIESEAPFERSANARAVTQKAPSQPTGRNWRKRRGTKVDPLERLARDAQALRG
ncbi:MAG: hypothetical protein ACRBCL_16755 [Maritimibacter sp.]